jgi:hypothetical protein
MTIPQQSVYGDLAPGIEGDFASANPHESMLAGEGTLVAGALGVIVGRFAFARVSDGLVFNQAPGSAWRCGFVHRNQPGAAIATWLGQSSMTAQPGTPITLFERGDFFARFAAGAVVGQKVYASLVDGTCRAGATGAPTTNALITANTTNGSATLTVTANTGANLTVGQSISGTGIPAGTIITALGTGTGGAGTYTMSANATASNTGITVTATTEYETAYRVHGVPNPGVSNVAAAGDLAMISTRLV